MKKIILAALLVGACKATTAQTTAIDINGGFAMFNAPSGINLTGINEKAKISPYAAVQLEYNTRADIGFGIGADVYSIRSTVPLDPHTFNATEVKFPDPKLKSAVTYADKAIQLYATVNKKIRLKKSQITVGVNGGLCISKGNAGTTSELRTDSIKGNGSNSYLWYNHIVKTSYPSGKGWLIGADLAYTYYITKHMGVDIHFRPRYYNISYDLKSNTYVWNSTIQNRTVVGRETINGIAYPLSVGIRLEI